VLDLSQNKITQVDKRLLEMIIESEYRLQEINLANNLLRVSSAEALFRNARYSKHLRRLNLSKNKLTPACLDALADMVEKSATLEQLYIGTNYLSGKAGERLFSILTGNKVLRVLDYSLNQLGDSGELACAKAIAGCFRVNRTLQHVDISFNNFGKEATEVIAEGLEPNKHIYGFHYRGNYGWVNSKGFLVLEEKQETLLDSIEQHYMNGFEVTVIRENHSLKSEPQKNVCWVCEGWHEQ
jgi:NLR family CARD domain-containing protein 3